MTSVPTPTADRRSSTASTVSWMGIALRSVTRWTTVSSGVQQPRRRRSIAIILVFARSAIAVVTSRKAADPAGRRGVDDDGVVHAVARLVGVDDPLLILPVSSTSRRPGATVVIEVDCADALHRAPGESQVVEHARGIRAARVRCRWRASTSPPSAVAMRVSFGGRGGMSKSWAIP